MYYFVLSPLFLSITLAFIISIPFRHSVSQGEFVQAAYRSSAAIIGMAFVQNIYGDYGMASLMIIGTVPLYNVMAVIVLALLKPGQSSLTPALMKKTIKGIITNPNYFRYCCRCCLVFIKNSNTCNLRQNSFFFRRTCNTARTYGYGCSF